MQTRNTGKRSTGKRLVTAPPPPMQTIPDLPLPEEVVKDEEPDIADTAGPAAATEPAGKEVVWPYTEFTRNEYTPPNKLHCRHCGKRISSQNTTRLKYHLLNRALCPTYLDYARQSGEGNKYVLEVLVVATVLVSEHILKKKCTKKKLTTIPTTTTGTAQ